MVTRGPVINRPEVSISHTPGRSITEGETVRRAWAVVAAVTDPELPMITLADLGVLRDVRLEPGGTGDDPSGAVRVVVEIAPTYSGCPALSVMRLDVARRLRAAGFENPDVRTVLTPPWSSDDITERGRAVLAEHGIAPPNPAQQLGCPVPLMLGPRRSGPVACPRCGSTDTIETSRFGATACKALYRCRACAEPFEYFKAH
jgi:ring-1,2-phenylacetyl-CoA epoxidase subunit PaaD